MDRLLSVRLRSTHFSCFRFSSRICWIRENNWFYTKDKFVTGLKSPAKLCALNLMYNWCMQIIGSDFVFHTDCISKESVDSLQNKFCMSNLKIFQWTQKWSNTTFLCPLIIRYLFIISLSLRLFLDLTYLYKLNLLYSKIKWTLLT
jgi:hypothetical protein